MAKTKRTRRFRVVVTTPLGRPGEVVDDDGSAAVTRWLRMGLLEEVPDGPDPETPPPPPEDD